MEIGLDWVLFKNGLATVLCRSFDHVMCSKGEGLWAQENRRISQRCGADRVDQRAFAASGFGRSGGRLIDLEQVGPAPVLFRSDAHVRRPSVRRPSGLNEHRGRYKYVTRPLR